MVALAPLPFVGTSAASAADDPLELSAYVVKVTNAGAYADSDATMLRTIDDALERWEVETDNRITFGRVGGFIPLGTVDDCDDYWEMVDEAKELPALKDVDFGSRSGNHLIVMSPGGCAGGHGTNGKYGLDSGGWVNFSYLASKSAHTLYHELGHNFGLKHANAIKCDPDCVPTDYRNWYSVMGASMVRTPAYVPAALDSYEREKVGALQAGELATVTLPEGRRTLSSTIELRGRGTSHGTRGVKVVDPADGSTYYFDFRSASGRDAGSYYVGAKASSEFEYNAGITVQQIVSHENKVTSMLQAHRKANGWKYAKVAGEAYEVGGIRMEVEAMQLTGSTADTARIRITLTDTSVPLGVQTGDLVLSGNGGIGDTMTASPTGWSEESTLSGITWYANGQGITGANGSTYVIPESLRGHELTARVTGKREGYHDRTAQSATIVAGEDRPGSLEDGAFYEIGLAGTTQVITNPDSSTSSGTQMVISSDQSADHQRWVALDAGDGTYRLRNVASTRCLDNTASSYAVGSKTIQWTCHTGDNQRWRLVGKGSGFSVINHRSGMPIASVGVESGSPITQQAAGQTWTFTKVG